MKTQKLLAPTVLGRACLLAVLGCATVAWAQTSASLSEQDFLAEMPIVLSVSRLPQRLDDTPGAVTIIDRDFIRLSGARDVADLLRLVPGFQTSTSFERVGPQVSYHGGFGGYSNRLQVLVDGRSTYSPYLIGGTEMGLQTVALPDIERIEVLRGSNSAAYGARAFLGVINIVTRDSSDTLGLQGSLAAGANGIRDSGARIGWGQYDATFRLSADRRADDGLLGSNGRNQVGRFNFRADLRLNARDEVELRAGSHVIDAGRGSVGNVDDAARDASFGTAYTQLDWRRNLGVDEDLAFSFSRTQESFFDSYPYSLIPLGINDSIDISASGRSSNDSLSLQHTLRYGSALRIVWGGELRREQVVSQPAYHTDAALITNFTRLFGNAEWRLAPSLLLNAGAMAERSSVDGASLAPRLMLNWHSSAGQTWRAGVSRAFRPPSAFERSADVRYEWNGHLLVQSFLATGKVRPESVLVREMGYLGEIKRLGFSLDLRAFHEQINGFVRNSLFDSVHAGVRDYINSEDFTIQGLEYQLKFRPWSGVHLIFNQTYTTISSTDLSTATAAPRLASSLALFQKLPGGLDLSLMHQMNGPSTLQGGGYRDQTELNRTDLRLALPVRFGANRGELALVVQNTGGPYQDFDAKFWFQRRAFVTLRLDN